MTKFLVYPERNPHAANRAQEITQARLQEVWGPDFNGQKVWPDKITTQAVSIIQHKDGRAAICCCARHDKHLSATERGNSKTVVEMRAEGFFPDEGEA